MPAKLLPGRARAAEAQKKPLSDQARAAAAQKKPLSDQTRAAAAQKALSQEAPCIILAGNPNVGKSTLFNALTGMHQKTGNWAGKTVACARGSFRFREKSIPVLDLPGTYSLQARSAEEIIARDRIAAGTRDLLVVVCDASCLERGLRFLKQIRDLGPRKPDRTALCVNLCDEAERNGIRIDFPFLAQALNLPVIPCAARDRRSVRQLKEKLAQLFLSPGCPLPAGCRNPEHQKNPELLPDFSPEETAKRAVTFTRPDFRRRQEAVDRLVTGPVWGAVLMLALLLAVFWLTIAGASVPSAWLSRFFTALEPRLFGLLAGAGLPEAVTDCAVRGVYRVTAWVIAVMLPPMAIFFPLFTLLEDLGYLPRAAYNMDCAFRRCHSCGKQCLTMCFVNASPEALFPAFCRQILQGSCRSVCDLPAPEQAFLKMRKPADRTLVSHLDCTLVIIGRLIQILRRTALRAAAPLIEKAQLIKGVSVVFRLRGPLEQADRHLLILLAALALHIEVCQLGAGLQRPRFQAAAQPVKRLLVIRLDTLFPLKIQAA